MITFCLTVCLVVGMGDHVLFHCLSRGIVASERVITFCLTVVGRGDYVLFICSSRGSYAGILPKEMIVAVVMVTVMAFAEAVVDAIGAS